MKILVIQQKMIGDVLASSIICNNLKAQYPTAQIDYLVYPFTVPVIENNPNIDNVIFFDEKCRKSKLKFFQFILKIRKAKYDIVIDAYAKLESILITKFSGAEKRIGYRQKELFNAYNVKVDHQSSPKTTAGLAIERRVNLFSELMPTKPIDNCPKLFLTDKEIEDAKSIFEKHQIDLLTENIIMISILGSDKNKTYPVPYIVEVINDIAKRSNVRILFNYIPKQLDEIKTIYELCSVEAKNKINLEIIGNSLRSFMGIMSCCKMIIGNDGGAVNIAKALNKPTFTIFSPWIQKESWSIFEDGHFNQAIHLNDFSPDLIAKNSRKVLKNKYLDFYNLLKPELFKDQLSLFLTTHLSSQNV